jgi:hypothetical protein
VRCLDQYPFHRVNYENHSAKVSECTECGICMERCPFEVDVIEKMKQAVRLIESS